MEIDKKLIQWIENELDKVEFGKVGIIFIMHEGRIVKIEKIHHRKIEYTNDEKT